MGRVVTGLVIGGVAGVLVLLVLIWVLLTYNRLVRLRNQVQNSWAQIEVQLKRRYDLVPNLVETVKGYAVHERDTLEAVTEARAAASSLQAPTQQAANDDALTGTLKSLFAVAEAYPDLKANQEFLQLQQQLEDTENRIAYARQYYNDAVLTLNTKVSTVPSVLVASMFGFRRAQFFQAGAGEAGPVPVQF